MRTFILKRNLEDVRYIVFDLLSDSGEVFYAELFFLVSCGSGLNVGIFFDKKLTFVFYMPTLNKYMII